MKDFQLPKVYLIAKPQLNILGIEEFLEDNNLTWNEPEHASDGDRLPEFAGRICYVSFGDKQGRHGNDKYLKNLISQGHGSVLEHANYSFLVTKASRGFTHEMVRHRAGFAYSQESTHFINYNPESGNISIPQLIKDNPDLYKRVLENAKISFENYAEIYNALRVEGIDKKVACSLSRGMLPIGIESKLVFTGNVRALRHFMVMRGNEHNVGEIRHVALQTYDLLNKECPNMLYDMHKEEFSPGQYKIVAEHNKV